MNFDNTIWIWILDCLLSPSKYKRNVTSSLCNRPFYGHDNKDSNVLAERLYNCLTSNAYVFYML